MIFCLVSFSQHNAFKVHPCCSMYWYFIPLYCQVTFHCVDILCCSYPFIDGHLGSLHFLVINYFFNTLFFKKIILKIYFTLFLAALGLRCCARAFSSCGQRRLHFVVVRWPPIAVASVVAEHELQVHGFQWLWLTGSRCVGFSSCGTRAQLLCGVWDLPGSGLEPVSPALAGGF